MASKMRATIFLGLSRIVLEGKPIPDVGPIEALINLAMTAIRSTTFIKKGVPA